MTVLIIIALGVAIFLGYLFFLSFAGAAGSLRRVSSLIGSLWWMVIGTALILSGTPIAMMFGVIVFAVSFYLGLAAGNDLKEDDASLRKRLG
jgi:pilus assembly protein TadC